MGSKQHRADTTEEVLRERIHHVFGGEPRRAASLNERPDFWVEPTDEQKSKFVLDLRDSVQLTDHVEIQHDAEMLWLSTPHPDLGGQRPEDMLTGDERSRTVLGNLIAQIEQGSFA